MTQREERSLEGRLRRYGPEPTSKVAFIYRFLPVASANKYLLLS